MFSPSGSSPECCTICEKGVCLNKETGGRVMLMAPGEMRFFNLPIADCQIRIRAIQQSVSNWRGFLNFLEKTRTANQSEEPIILPG